MPLFCFDAGGSVLRAYGGGVRPDCLCAYGFAHFGTLPFFATQRLKVKTSRLQSTGLRCAAWIAKFCRLHELTSEIWVDLLSGRCVISSDVQSCDLNFGDICGIAGGISTRKRVQNPAVRPWRAVF